MGIRRIGCWLLVVFGIAIAIFGFIGMGFYSPSLSEEELLRGALVGELIFLTGIIMVVAGWFVLRANKREMKGV